MKLSANTGAEMGAIISAYVAREIAPLHARIAELETRLAAMDGQKVGRRVKAAKGG